MSVCKLKDYTDEELAWANECLISETVDVLGLLIEMRRTTLKLQDEEAKQHAGEGRDLGAGK